MGVFMAGYQFFHIESYGREESKKQQTITRKTKDGSFLSVEVDKGKSGGVRYVIAEGGREEDNAPHVKHPQPPIILMGDLKQVEQEAYDWAEQATDANGRKLRKDGHCLLAGTISLPRSEEANWQNFKDRSIKWLKEKYGDNLRCIIEHQDEPHPHIHFYCVPKFGQSFDTIHEGKRAQNALKQENSKAKKSQQNIAYADAMRATQDDFNKKVGQVFGLARLGPGRRRLSRAEWKAEQKQAEALQNTLAQKQKYKRYFKEQAIKSITDEERQKAKSFGNKIGGIFNGIANGWNTANKKLQKEKEELETKFQMEMKRAEEEKKKITDLADRRVLDVADDLRAEKDKNQYLEKELKRTEKQLADLRPVNDRRNGKDWKI